MLCLQLVLYCPQVAQKSFDTALSLTSTPLLNTIRTTGRQTLFNELPLTREEHGNNCEVTGIFQVFDKQINSERTEDPEQMPLYLSYLFSLQSCVVMLKQDRNKVISMLCTHCVVAILMQLKQ